MVKRKKLGQFLNDENKRQKSSSSSLATGSTASLSTLSSYSLPPRNYHGDFSANAYNAAKAHHKNPVYLGPSPQHETPPTSMTSIRTTAKALGITMDKASSELKKPNSLTSMVHNSLNNARKQGWLVG